MTNNITDHGDFCRHCGGDGGTADYEADPYTGEMRERRNPCYHCEGTGKKTVLIGGRSDE